MGETCEKVVMRPQVGKLSLSEIIERQNKVAPLLATARQGMRDLVSSTEEESLAVLADADGYVLQAEGTRAGNYIGRNWTLDCCNENAFIEVIRQGKSRVLPCSELCPYRSRRAYSMAAPIIEEGRTIAVLGLWVSKAENFKSLFSFLKHLAKGIERELAVNRAYAGLATANTYLAAIAELTRWATSAWDKRELLQKVVTKLAGIAGVEAAVIMLPDSDQEKLISLAATDEEGRAYTVRLEGDSLSPLVAAFKSKQTVIKDQEHTSYRDGCCPEAILVAPVIVQGEVLGVIGGYQATPRTFSREAVIIFEAAAGLVGQILENLKLHKEAVREHYRLTNIMEQIDAALVLIDCSGLVIKSNATFDKWFGAMGKINGKTLEEVEKIHGLSGGNLSLGSPRKIFEEVISEDKSFEFEFRSQLNNGRHFRLKVEPVKVNGHIDCVVVTVIDVTENYHLEKVKAEILATISHELRTPITAIKGYLDIIDMIPVDSVDSLQSGVLPSIRKEVKILSTLVEKVVAFNRFQLYRYQFKPENLNLTKLVERTMKLLKGAAESKGLQMSFTYPGDQNFWMWGDAWGLQEVIYHLLDNAIKFSQSKGMITVGLTEGDRLFRLEVENSGKGIPIDERDKVFEQFYRGVDAANSGIPGNGLGLFIAKHIVEQHGGSVVITDGGVDGTKIIVTLPAKGGNTVVKGSNS